jgi:hypothetical protein
MTAQPAADDQPFSIVLDDDEGTTAEGRWRPVDAGPTWAKHRVTLRIDDADTSGHAHDPLSVSISLYLEDDVEGHALSLRFPSAEKADEFRRRLVATGIVAGALIVGVTTAQLAATASPGSLAAPAPIVAPAPHAAPMVNPRTGENLAPAAPAPIVAPAVNPRIPAEDLAPAAPAPIVAPAVNPRIPAEDLAPAAPAPIVAPADASSAQRHLEQHK